MNLQMLILYSQIILAMSMEVDNYPDPVSAVQDYLQERQDNNELTLEEAELLVWINVRIKENLG